MITTTSSADSSNKRRRIKKDTSATATTAVAVPIKLEEEINAAVVVTPTVPDKTMSRITTTTMTTNNNNNNNNADNKVALLVPQLSILPQLLTLDIPLPQDPTLVARALTQLAEVLRQGITTNTTVSAEETRRHANELGAALAVISAMRKFPYHKVVQREGCSCICLLAYCPTAIAITSGGVQQYRNTLLQCGSVEVALNAMTLFPRSQGVQKQACFALMNTLSSLPPTGSTSTANNSNNNSSILEAMAHRFVYELDGIARIVAVMKQYSKITDIQVAGCGILGNLAAQQPSCHAVMRDAKAVSVVAAALEDHSHHASVVTNGNKFMVHLFS